MQQENVNYWDTHPQITALIVLIGSAATSMVGAYVPSAEFGKPATFLFWMVLTSIAAIILYGLRFAFERSEGFSKLPFWTKIMAVWITGVLVFSPFSELLDMAIGLTQYPAIPSHAYNERTHLLLSGIGHEVLCASSPMLYMTLLFDMLWFSRKPQIAAKAPQPLPSPTTTESSLSELGGAETDAEAPETLPAVTPPLPPRFLTRANLPNTASILHIEAQQHYIMVKTSAGNDLVYYRFGDAIADLADTAGLQVHRSHWIAETAVQHISKQARSMEITLYDGQIIPVSRNRQAAIKAAGWLNRDFKEQRALQSDQPASFDRMSFA